MTHASYPPLSIIACVDGSDHQQFVLTAARWAACELKSPVGLLHAHDHKLSSKARDYSGSLSADGKERLLKSLTEAEAAQAKSQKEEGWKVLEEAKEVLGQIVRQQIFTLHWHDTLTNSLKSLQPDTSLVILGQTGDTDSKVGRQVHAAVRNCKQPLMLVNSNFKRPEKALLAFDARSGSTQALEWVCKHPLFYATEITVLMVGEDTPKNQQSLRHAVAVLKQTGRKASSKITSGKLTQCFKAELASSQYQCLIMGAYGHSALREWVLGSNTEALLAMNPGCCLTFS